MSEIVLSAQQAGRRVDGRWIWRNLNVKLCAGQRLALTGPTGSGKSLLLRGLVGLDALDEGRVCYRNEAVQGKSLVSIRNEFTYLPQRPSFRDGVVGDVFDRPFRFSANTEKSLDAALLQTRLEAFNLGNDLDKPVAKLSGGEAQIVALLRALTIDPNVLLLDEPTSAMDTDTADRAEELIGQWLRENPARALIWVSHDLDRLKKLTDSEINLLKAMNQ